MRIFKTILLTLLMAVPGLSQVPSPQVPFTGTIGSGGNFPLLNSGSFAITDSNYTVAYPNTTCISCQITGTITAPRTVTWPAGKFTLFPNNATAGGFAINIVIGTCSAVSIPNGSMIGVWSDGTNCHQIGGSSSGITALTGDGTATGPGSASFILASVNSNPGCYTLSGLYTCFNAKGLATSIGSPFSASFGCTPCASSPYEIGYSGITSASGTISYANPTIPTSASVSDGTNTTTLTTPFTSWTLSHTYTASLTPTVFTLTALGNGQTVTPTQSFTGAYATFSGLTTGGTASGATAGGSATGGLCANETVTLTGLTGTLSCVGLGNTYAGQSFTFATPGGSYISLLLTGGCGHTLTVGGFTTTFLTHALTYTNIEGGSQTGMCVYTSPAPASISTTVVVASL